MDMTIATGGMVRAVAAGPPLIQEVGGTAREGILPGAPLSVPVGYAGVILRGFQTLYVLGSGEHALHPHLFPLLAQQKSGRSVAMEGALYLVRTSDISDFPWEASLILADNSGNGMTCSGLRGRFWGRIVDPGRFAPLMLQQAAQHKAAAKSGEPFAQACLNAAIAPLMSQALGQAAGTGAQQTGIAPAHWQMAHEDVRAAAAHSAAFTAGQMGIQTLGFQIDALQGGMRAACVGCGSTTAPTTYATFRRTISLLYVRFGQEQSGNFCSSCAIKRALTDNGIMLVCGWWGIIGFFLTPIYFCSNLYHLCRVLAAPKASSADEARQLQA